MTATAPIATMRDIVRTIAELDYCENRTAPNPYHPTEPEYHWWNERRREIARMKTPPHFRPDNLKQRLKEFYTMAGPINDGMLRVLQNQLKTLGMEGAGEFLRHFGINTPKELSAARINEALDWIKERTP